MSKLLTVHDFNELISKGKVVIDANVLLQAYQYKGIDFEKIMVQLELLAKQKRLIIPISIIDEFTRNRPECIKKMEQSLSQIIQEIDDELKKLKIPPSKSLLEIAPYFAGTMEFKSAKQAKDEIRNRIVQYRDELTLLHEKTLGLFTNDPYLTRIDNLISTCSYSNSVWTSIEELELEGLRRNEKNIPPGYKDKGKGNKGGDPYGDLSLWGHILTINDNVLFITNDSKPDWFLNGNNGKALDLRIELQQEFYNTTNFYIKGINSKVLENDFGVYFTPLRMEILEIIKTLDQQEVYDNYSSLSKLLVKHFDKRNVFSHIKSDAQRIDRNGYIFGLEVSHAEMAFAYLNGHITEKELEEGFEESARLLEDFWDNRFWMK